MGGIEKSGEEEEETERSKWLRRGNPSSPAKYQLRIVNVWLPAAYSSQILKSVTARTREAHVQFSENIYEPMRSRQLSLYRLCYPQFFKRTREGSRDVVILSSPSLNHRRRLYRSFAAVRVNFVELLHIGSIHSHRLVGSVLEIDVDINVKVQFFKRAGRRRNFQHDSSTYITYIRCLE